MGLVEERAVSSGVAGAGRILREALLCGVVLGGVAFLVIARVNEGPARESATFSLLGVVLSALVGCLIAGAAACAGLIVMRLVGAHRRWGRLRVSAGSVAAGLAAWLLTRVLIVPELLLPSLLPAVAGCVGCALAAVILIRSQRERTRSDQ